MANSDRGLLLIAPYFPPSGRVGAKRAMRMAEGLKASGWEPTVLTLDPISTKRLSPFLDESLVPDPLRITIIRVRGYLPGVRLSRWGARAIARRGLYPPIGHAARIVGKLLEAGCVPDPLCLWAPLALPVALRLVKLRRIAVLLATARPFSSFVLGFLISRLTKIPLVLDYRDPWTTQTDPASRPPAWRRSFEKGLERMIAVRASHIFFTSRSRAQQFVHSLGPRLKPKTSWLPNAIDPETPADQKITGEPISVLLHAGNLYGGRSIATLLESLRRLEEDGLLPRDSVRVEVRGTLDRWTRAHLEASPVTKRFLLLESPLPHAAIRARMARSRGLLLVVAPEHASDIPAKLFEYLATSRPILCLAPPGSEASRLVETLRAGLCVDPDDEAGLRESLLQIVYDRVAVEPKSGQRAAFQSARLTARLSEVLEAVSRQEPATDHSVGART